MFLRSRTCSPDVMPSATIRSLGHGDSVTEPLRSTDEVDRHSNDVGRRTNLDSVVLSPAFAPEQTDRCQWWSADERQHYFTASGVPRIAHVHDASRQHDRASPRHDLCRASIRVSALSDRL